MKPLLLVLISISDKRLAMIGELFEVLHAPDAARRAKAVASRGAEVQAVLSNGTTGLRADEIDTMPQLRLACALGAGYETIAVAHARSRGVALANGAGTNDDCVADHAFALLLAVGASLLQKKTQRTAKVDLDLAADRLKMLMARLR